MKQRIFSFLKFIFTTLFSLYLLIWLLSPQIFSYYLQESLTPHKLRLSNKSALRYNPFLSTLNVENLVLIQDKEIVFAVKKLALGLSLYQLVFDRLYINKLTIEGVLIAVEKQGDNIRVAGFANNQNATNNVPASEPQAPSALELVMPLLTVSNVKIAFSSPEQNLTFHIPSANISELKADQQKQSAHSEILAKFHGSTLSLKSYVELMTQQGLIETSLDLKNTDLSLLAPWLPKDIEKISGYLDVTSKQRISYISNKTDIKISDLETNVDRFFVQQNNAKITVDENNLTAKELDIILSKNDPVKVFGNASLSTKRIELANGQNSDQQAAYISQLLIDEINIDTPARTPEVTLAQVQVDNVAISKDKNSELPPLVAFKQFLVTNVKLSNNAALITSAAIEGLSVDAQLDQEKQLANMTALNSVASDKSPTTSPAQTSPQNAGSNQPYGAIAKPAFHLAINDFHLTDTAKFYFKDTSVEPNYRKNITLEQLQLGPIDNFKPKQNTQMMLSGKSDQYGKFELTSVSRPFDRFPFYSLNGFINEISLPAISPYIKKSLDKEIKSGQLNLKLNTQLTGSELSGDTDIFIRALNFSAVNEDSDALKGSPNIPFAVALNMLKDSKGNVKLNVPISGNTDDPKFGFADIAMVLTKKASMAAAKSYLMQTFVPYANVVSIAMSAGEQLLKVRFNDLIFPKASSDVKQTDATFLAQFAQLLKDKPDVHVTICPIAVPADIGLKSESELKEPKRIAQLNQLSEQRFHNFKQLIMEQYLIESSRLLSCLPTIDKKKGAKPRLTFKT